MMRALAVAAGIAGTAKFRAEHIAETLDAGYLDATALAEYLVGKGVPFRQAHHVVGSLVARAAAGGRPLAELPLDELLAASDLIGPDVYKHLGAANVVKRYAPAGAAGPKHLRQPLTFWRKKLA